MEPQHVGTIAEKFLPLTYVRARDPDATVVVYPSDHFVYPEDRFLASVQRVVWPAEWFPDRLVVLAVPPDRLELGYGWLIPGERPDGTMQYQVRAVAAVLERLTPAQADEALSRGALWNTSVLAAKGETLWQLGRQCCPDLMARFDQLYAAVGTAQEARVLDQIYPGMPAYDFTSDVLPRVRDRASVVEMCGVLWSDWGTPERIAHTLRWIGRQPAFPPTCLASPFAPRVRSKDGAPVNL